MVRAIFFDFYSVWLPDAIQNLLNEAAALGPEESAALAGMVESYYHGVIGLEKLADTFRFKLGRADIDAAHLTLQETDISPNVATFMRGLHGHFLKLGVLGNLGAMELDLLHAFNKRESLFEVVISPMSLEYKQTLLSKEVFNKALKLIGEKPNTCVAVSGHDDYLAFAHSLGMTPVKFEGMPSLSQTLSQILAKDLPTFIDPSVNSR